MRQAGEQTMVKWFDLSWLANPLSLELLEL